jgi:hypothetical protein
MHAPLMGMPPCRATCEIWIGIDRDRIYLAFVSVGTPAVRAAGQQLQTIGAHCAGCQEIRLEIAIQVGSRLNPSAAGRQAGLTSLQL